MKTELLGSLFLSPLLFSLCAEEFSLFDIRVSSLLIYFSTLASTSVMVACGFFEMENIISFDCTHSPTMKVVMANIISYSKFFNCLHITSDIGETESPLG